MAAPVNGQNTGASLFGALSPLAYLSQMQAPSTGGGFMRPPVALPWNNSQAPGIAPLQPVQPQQNSVPQISLWQPPPPPPNTPGLHFDMSPYLASPGFLGLSGMLSMMRDHPEMIQYMDVQSG